MKANRKKLPFVFINVAMTADGKIAPANRNFIPFSSKRDQTHILELRTEADAVMSGARTVDLGPVTLGAGGAKYRHLRVKNGFPNNHCALSSAAEARLIPTPKFLNAVPLH